MENIVKKLIKHNQFIHLDNGKITMTKICVTDLVDDYVLIPGLRIFGHKEEIITFVKLVDRKFLEGVLSKDNYDSCEEANFPYFLDGEIIKNIRLYKDISEHILNEPDLIILGCGTTSCCIVNQLKDTNLKIVVINQGPIIEDENTKRLANFMTVFKDPKYTNIVGISDTKIIM